MWPLLTKSVTLARDIQRAEQALRGGVISDALVEFGGVMAASARVDLAEARHSPDPRRRVGDAAAALQVAYLANERALERGAPVALRTLTQRLTGQYRDALGRVAGTAAGVAVLRGYLDEPAETLRAWLDRVARPVALERAATQATSEYGSPFQWGSGITAHGDAAVRQHLISYFNLERLLLPPELVRPLPPAWKQTEGGVAAKTKREREEGRRRGMSPEVRNLLPPVEEWTMSPLQTDEPGPQDVILWTPVADVVPVYECDV